MLPSPSSPTRPDLHQERMLLAMATLVMATVLPALVLWAPKPPTARERSIGSISVEGGAERRRAGSSEWMPLARHEDIFPHDTVLISRKGRALVVLPREVVALEPNALIRFDEGRKERVLYTLLRGKARAVRFPEGFAMKSRAMLRTLTREILQRNPTVPVAPATVAMRDESGSLGEAGTGPLVDGATGAEIHDVASARPGKLTDYLSKPLVPPAVSTARRSGSALESETTEDRPAPPLPAAIPAKPIPREPPEPSSRSKRRAERGGDARSRRASSNRRAENFVRPLRPRDGEVLWISADEEFLLRWSSLSGAKDARLTAQISPSPSFSRVASYPATGGTVQVAAPRAGKLYWRMQIKIDGEILNTKPVQFVVVHRH